jgi:hypothetical protein
MSKSPAKPHKPEPKKKKSRPILRVFLRLLLAFVGIGVMIVGGIQLNKGNGESSEDAQAGQVHALFVSSEKSVEEANKLITAAVPQFQQLLDAVDKSGHAAVGKEKADLANRIGAQFASAAGLFREAAKDLDDYRQQVDDTRLDAYATDRAAACRRMADVEELNQQLAQLVLDTSLADAKAFTAKVDQLVAQRDAALKAANELSAKADEAAKTQAK